MGLLKLLSTSEIVAQVISFLILLTLLRLFVWKRFLKLLDDRKERIAAELKSIEDSKADIEKLRLEYEGMIGRIEATSRARIEKAIAEGKRIAEEVKLDAERGAQKMVENAKAAIKDEIAKARETLKEDVVDLAISAAGKVIEEKLTEKEDRRIVQDFLDKMDKKA